MKGSVTYRDPVRPIDFDFACQLEVVDQTVDAMPGSWVIQRDPDPRLTQLKPMLVAGDSVGRRATTEVPLCERIAVIRHKKTNHFYVVFKETMESLFARQRDTAKFPEWLMKSPVKKTELKIFVAHILGKPRDKHDKQWLEFLDDDKSTKIFDSIVWYLVKKEVVPQEYFARS